MSVRHIDAEELPYSAVVRHVWIPMSDGVRLHARIWLPAGAGDAPVPALLEYVPYRKSDWTLGRDNERHPWYAGHGYASVRVDVRGSGDSEGVFTDEYSEQELTDGEEVIAWLADQPWCSGSVGMFGISWGGFNSLQIAARRPPALRAVVTVCSTDDRYDNDVHYVGGAVLGIDMTAWAGTMLAFMSRPPEPQHVGDAWLPMWRERLDAVQPMLLTWLDHQTRDDYWRRGSVCEDYSAVEVPVLAVGGWADPYTDTVLRLVEHLPGFRRGIIGPWAHQYPDRAADPGPAIGFLQETLRWWDRWLKGSDTGVEDDADLRVFLEAPRPPATTYGDVPGTWLATEWPTARVAPHRRALERASVPVADGWATVATPVHVGVDSGRFFPFGNVTDLPPDQRAEDGRSVVIDSEPLTEDLHLLGIPRVRLRVDCDRPRAHVIARLCDVAPDGSSRLLSRGVLNLSARRGREQNVPWVPGEIEDVELPLTGLGATVAAGHVLRLALSTSYFPWVWPHAKAATVRVHLPSSSLDLPRLDAARVPAGDEVDWEEPEHHALADTVIDTLAATDDRGAPVSQRVVTHDAERDTWTLDVDPGYLRARTFHHGLFYGEDPREQYVITAGDPGSAVARSDWEVRMTRGSWSVHIVTHQEVTATAEAFRVRASVRAASGGSLVAERHWDELVPRTVG